MTTIMLLDDEENVVNGLQRILRKQVDWDVVGFTVPYDALETATKMDIDVFISDYRMPTMNGVEFLALTKTHNPSAARIILSGQADFDSLVEAINVAQIFRFLSKPVQEAELFSAINQALKVKEGVAANKGMTD